MLNDYSNDFSESGVISFDAENHDPNLKLTGPSIRSGGFVLGMGLSDETGFSTYYTLDHPDTTDEENENNTERLRRIFSSDIPKLGMNLLYDMDWVINGMDMKINGRIIDIMIAEGLINENQRQYNLNFISTKYLQKTKDEIEITQWCKRRGLKGKPQEHLAKMPGGLVGPYCEEDTLLPTEIYRIQKKILESEGLMEVFEMEMKLLPILIQMRGVGVPINRTKIFAFEDYLAKVLFETEDELYEIAGHELNYNSSDQIGKVCDKLGIEYSLSPKSKKPSINKEFLEANMERYPLLKCVSQCRKYKKMLSTFVESQLIKQIEGDRIYCQFHSSKSDKGGTITGRFSGSNPNLQFMPNPKSELNEDEDLNLGNAIREIFIAEANHWWGKIDYSQIEIRLLAHYAIGEKADEIRAKYNSGEKVDYHQWCADIAGIDRHRAKKINFSIIYGMGIGGVAKKLGISYYDAKEFYENYLHDLPFIKATLKKAKDVAENRGYVRTIMGRRRRFPERNFSYKALNAIIQGSAADVMKKGMVDAYEEGIFEILIPHLTVHDELDFSIPKTKEGIETTIRLKQIMEDTIKLKVPLVADCEVGNNWADATEKTWEEISTLNAEGVYNGLS